MFNQVHVNAFETCVYSFNNAWNSTCTSNVVRVDNQMFD